MNYEFIRHEEPSIALVNISNDKAGFGQLYNYPIWSVSRIRSKFPNSVLNLNSERNAVSKVQLESIYDPFYQKISSMLEEFKAAKYKNVLFVDVQFFEDDQFDVILEGEEFCDPYIWKVITSNLNSTQMRYRIGGSPLGFNLIRKIGNPTNGIHAFQMNLNQKLLTTMDTKINLPEAVITYEITVSLAGHFCKAIT